MSFLIIINLYGLGYSKLWILVRHGMPVKREGAVKDGQSSSVYHRPEMF